MAEENFVVFHIMDEMSEVIDCIVLGDAATTRFKNAEGVYVITDVPDTRVPSAEVGILDHHEGPLP